MVARTVDRHGGRMPDECTHLDQVDADAQPSSTGCEDCLRDGRPLGAPADVPGCGHVGCCDSSPNKHAQRALRTRPATRWCRRTSRARTGGGASSTSSAVRRRTRPSRPYTHTRDRRRAEPRDPATVDDDPSVSRAVARDLRRRYGEDHRVVRASSGRRGPRGAARDQAARRAGGGAAGRLPDAGDERHRVPRAGDGPVPAGPPGPAHRVRRHRRGDRGDQRRRRRPLPAQAVGPAGGEALPGGRRDARRRTWRRGDVEVRETKVVGHRWSAPSFEVRDFLARNAVPYRWFAADEPEGRRLLQAAGVDAHDGCRWSSRPTARRWSRRRTAEVAAAVGLSTTPADRLLRPGHRRRRAGRARRGGLRRVRGPAHPAGRARGDRRPGRPVVADRELPRLPGRRLRCAAHRPGPPAGDEVRRRDPHRPRRHRAARRRPGAGRAASATAPRSPRTR